MSGSVLSTANVTAHARIVRDKALKRQLIRAVGQVAERTYEEEDEAEQLLARAQQDIFDIQRDYVELLTALAKLMSPGGVIYFSTNFKRFKFDESALAGAAPREISKQTVPEDFRNKRIHRCWRIVAGGDS